MAYPTKPRELKDHRLYCAAIHRYEEFLAADGWIEDKISACMGLSECYMARKQNDDALQALHYSFMFDLPRPETCCRIANIYFGQEDYTKAIYWYMLALDSPYPKSGFIYQDYIEFIPHIQLCVCFDRIGDKERAIWNNEEAARIKPDNAAVIHNREWFNQ